jgi:pimeloyl-ACP methyl ester carboxylesterase
MRDGGHEDGLSRRGVLLGAAGGLAAVAGAGLLVEQDVLPGRSRAYSALGLNGDGAPMPDAEPGELVSGTFRSQARGGVEVGWAVSYPSGFSTDADLPVLLVLHGASFDHRSAFKDLGLDRFLTLAVRDGVPPFTIASIDGGRTYWRSGPGGTDSSRMLTDEFLPLLGHRGLAVDRLAVGGWSMGGYGALRLAGLGTQPVRAVAVSSPALSVLASGSPEDDVLGHPERLGAIPLRIDCGRGDPFFPVVEEFADELDPAPSGTFGPGGHTPGYWRSVAPEQLAFVGEHLG